MLVSRYDLLKKVLKGLRWNNKHYRTLTENDKKCFLKLCSQLDDSFVGITKEMRDKMEWDAFFECGL